MNTATTTATATPAVLLVPLDRLQPADDNLRGPVGDVAELARSIAGIGIVEPLLVTPLDGEPGRYLIVAGHRRHLAAERAGLATAPCLVRDMSDAARIEVMLVENLQRSGIPVLAEAAGYFRLVGEHGYTIRRLARQVGRSERHVRSRLALLELPEAAQAALTRDDLSLGQAEALLAARDRPEVIDDILTGPEWRRRDMEQAVADALRRAEREDRRSALIAELEATGVRVVADEGNRPQSYVRLPELGLDEAVHQGEACHAVVVEIGYGGPSTVAVCTDRRRHTRRAPANERSDLQAEPPAVDPERERARERRRLAERRGGFLMDRLSGRLPKAGAVDLIVAALLDRANTNDDRRAGALLAVEAHAGRYGEDWRTPLAQQAARSDTDRLRVGVAVAAAMAEARMAAATTGSCASGYREFLVAIGYEAEATEFPVPPDDAAGPFPTPTTDPV